MTHGHIEHVIVEQNKESEILAKTFYKYENGLLISEESYTGYAYLESPRKISQISYKYENGLLAEKNKKYSLNGEHWIQTWVTKFDKSGRKTVLKETENGKINSYEYKFNSNNQIEKITVLSEEDKKIIKEITYYTNGSPKSILWYWVKRQKPIRMTKYFYK